MGGSLSIGVGVTAATVGAGGSASPAGPTYGPEILLNGDFSGDSTGIWESPGGDFGFAGAATSFGEVTGYFRQALATPYANRCVAGHDYRLRLTVQRNDGGYTVQAGGVELVTRQRGGRGGPCQR